MTMDQKEPEPLQVPIKTAAIMLGCCRQTLYKMRADNQITFGRMRGRTMVPMAEIQRIHAMLYVNRTAAPPAPLEEAVKELKSSRPKKVRLFPRVGG
jgi:hypothetical protein